MQTFLPYPDFIDTARCLDNSRLGNQCYRECKTLIQGGWTNHPASKMWQGYSHALARYGLALALELLERPCSYRHAVAVRWISFYETLVDTLTDTGDPPWLGSRAFHDAHKSNLLRKDPEWYGQFGWQVTDDLPYVWPV